MLSKAWNNMLINILKYKIESIIDKHFPLKKKH